MLADRAILTLPAGDIGGPDGVVTGEFQLAGNLEITPSFRTGYIIGGSGSAINTVIQQFVGEGEARNGQGFFLDLGSGAHVIECAFRGWRGAQDANGNPLQWGNTGDPSTKTYEDTTGEIPLSQINCLEQYLRSIKIDSASPATLEYGEYSPSGMYEPLDVVLEGPTFTSAAEDGAWFDGTLTMIEAAAIEDVYAAEERTE